MENIKESVKNKFYVETEMISSPYYKKDSPASLEIISDIHYHKNVDKAFI